MAKIKFYMDDEPLPVNPEKLECTIAGRQETVDIVSGGQVVLLKSPALQTLSFQTFIPKYAVNSYSGGGYIETNHVYDAQYYIDRYTDLMNSNAGFNFVVSGLDIDLEVVMTSFDYWWGQDNSDPDLYIKFEMQQYRAPIITTAAVKAPDKPPDSPAPETPAPPRENPKKSVTIGCTVIANGQLHKDSDGQGPGATEVNAQRKINFIKSGKPYPYHLTTLSGGWRGWVSASSVEVV